MIEVAKVLQRGITFVWSNILDQTWLGVPLSGVVFGLFAMAMVIRFIVMPLFGGGFHGAGSDFVKHNKGGKDE